ncbi:MAG: hypothetical protein ABFD79_16605 [Phycisphaerales bacterium]
MKKINKHFILAFFALIALPQVICAVNEFAWRTDFAPIVLTNISQKSDVQEGSSTITLDVSGFDDEAIITANNEAGSVLTNGTDTLITEYKLTFDGDGTSKSGGNSMENYVSAGSFLDPGMNIKYVPGDQEVEVKLHVRASNRADGVSDSGNYTATQTLTITWDGL